MPPLEQNEKILFIARKHWFVFVGESIFLFLLAILPVFLLFMPQFIPESLASLFGKAMHVIGTYSSAVLFLWFLELLVVWGIFALLWTDYYLDVWFVTNLRIIAIEQRGMFNRNISTFRLDMIQDVTAEVPNLFATLIDYGTVRVQTASSETFKLRGAAHPNTLKAKINAEHHRAHAKRSEVTVVSPAQETAQDEQSARF